MLKLNHLQTFASLIIFKNEHVHLQYVYGAVGSQHCLEAVLKTVGNAVKHALKEKKRK